MSKCPQVEIQELLELLEDLQRAFNIVEDACDYWQQEAESKSLGREYRRSKEIIKNQDFMIEKITEAVRKAISDYNDVIVPEMGAIPSFEELEDITDGL